jgi:hypothetical protein
MKFWERNSHFDFSESALRLLSAAYASYNYYYAYSNGSPLRIFLQVVPSQNGAYVVNLQPHK